jgi:hypothetical protein
VAALSLFSLSLKTDYCEDPLEVFSYLKTNKIGEKDAVFYERWASALEHRGNQALCQKVYEAGILKYERVSLSRSAGAGQEVKCY